MQHLDPKIYPLASTPTPSKLKNIGFELDGKATLFREATGLAGSVESFDPEDKMLKAEHGPQPAKEFDDIPREKHVRPIAAYTQSSMPEMRPTSPASVSDHFKPGFGKRVTVTNRRPAPVPRGASSLDGLSQSQPHDIQTSPGNLQERPWLKHSVRTLMGSDAFSTVDRMPLSPSTQRQDDSQPTALVFDANQPQSSFSHDIPPTSANPQSRNIDSTSRFSTSHYLDSQPTIDTVVPTPPIQGDEQQFTVPPARRYISSVPSRLTSANVGVTQDGSLPSPSLSPVAAAANLQNMGYFAETDRNSDSASQLDPEGNEEIHLSFNESGQRTFDFKTAAAEVEARNSQRLAPNPPQSSITDIPAMLEFFEAIPDQMKSYVMHHLLRRCSRPTLRVVADLVVPALKCDFVGILPPELSLNILRFLDAKSLCRASQVSKKWRHMINSDEQAWRDLLDTDGFSLPREEIQRAIFEGWGWQDPVGMDGREYDIGTTSVNAESDSDTSLSLSISYDGMYQDNQVNSRRPKRKATMKLSARKKQPKCQETAVDICEQLESIDLMKQMSSADGPYNAASAAAWAVPYPKIGLSSLRDLHLFKSLYRRHYMIRKNWMHEDSKPRHTAFRAHDRHVVTCLGFDDDKIITGSDDNNINVYDTKTGALRFKLKGHEGGVWALQYEGNVLVSGSTDRTVRVWDIETGRQMQVFHGHTSTVRCLQILLPTKIDETAEGKAIVTPRQPLVITGSRDSSLRVWRLPQTQDPRFIQSRSSREDIGCPYFVRVLTGHQHSVRAIAAHADTLVSGSYDCTVRVWKISTGETVHRLQGHTQKVYSVVLDHKGNRCISGSMDYLVKIWSLDTGSVLHTLGGHSSLVGLLDLNSERLVSAAADWTLRIWDPDNGQCQAVLKEHTGAITCFQHDGQKVISGSDRTLKMWDIHQGYRVRDLLTDLSGVWQVKFNGRRCVAAVQRDHVTYIEVSNTLCVMLIPSR